MTTLQKTPDFSAIRTFFKVIGKPTGTARLRGFFPNGHPAKGDDRGRKAPPSRKAVEEWQAEGRGVYVVINDGGDTDADITGCRVVLPKEPEAVLLGSAVLGAVASGHFKGVLPAMAAMNAADRIIAPTKGAVARYHAAKYQVFHRLHADFLAYRKLMAAV
jgi:hypothetical protein